MWRSSSVSNVELLLSPSLSLLCFNREWDSWGLYAQNVRNEKGTPLVASGTLAELELFLKKRSLTARRDSRYA